ncbi:MAG: hypothetical protein GQ468_04960 [Candidatus Scalindua sp.]|nr:hypothetical protein [Candidatus Scalindua sp.]
MRTHIISFIYIVILFAFNSLTVSAQDTTKSKIKVTTQSHVFVDEDGDGYNDIAPDHDGDGIPNGLDSDWQKVKRASRNQFVDLDGDGINDNLQIEREKWKHGEQQTLYREEGSSLNNTINKNTKMERQNGKGKDH